MVYKQDHGYSELDSLAMKVYLVSRSNDFMWSKFIQCLVRITRYYKSFSFMKIDFLDEMF